MKVIIANKSGFCFGVKRAIDLCIEEASKKEDSKEIRTYGEMVHNKFQIEDLKKRNINVIENIEDLAEDMTVLVRAHGITKDEEDKLKIKAKKVIDATCPFVSKIHKIAEESASLNNLLIIIGDKNHVEVIGIKGHTSNNNTIVLGDVPNNQEIDDINKTYKDIKEKYSNSEIDIVVQTTYKNEKLKNILKKLDDENIKYNLHNTICTATRDRQEAAKKLAKEVDTMIIIGDSKSSNSNKLYEICIDLNKNSYMIESVSDLKDKILKGTVGITAGASTPNFIIKEVEEYIKNI